MEIFFETLFSSSAVLLSTKLVGLCRVLVPQVLVPVHPAIIKWVAVSPVVVAIGGIAALPITITIFGLNLH